MNRRAVERQSILKHENATLDRILLQAGTTDLDARLVIAAEEVLHHHSRNHPKCVRDGQIGGFRHIFLRDQSNASGKHAEALGDGRGGASFDKYGVQHRSARCCRLSQALPACACQERRYCRHQQLFVTITQSISVCVPRPNPFIHCNFPEW